MTSNFVIVKLLIFLTSFLRPSESIFFNLLGGGGGGCGGCSCPQPIPCPPAPVCPQPIPCQPLPPPPSLPIDPCASTVPCSGTAFNGQWGPPAPQIPLPEPQIYSTAFSQNIPATNTVYNYGYDPNQPISIANIPANQIIEVSSATLIPHINEGYAPVPQYDQAESSKIAVNPSTQMKELPEVSFATGQNYENSFSDWQNSGGNTNHITTEGKMSPYNEMFEKRYKILRRIKNAQALSADVPRTRTTCNSHQLASVMVKAIVNDVSVAKRMVLKATELAFDGAKFDVFCATGEFSYSIHSRTYCEVTREDVTCFAFR